MDHLLACEDSALVVVDVQEKLAPAIVDIDAAVEGQARLIQVARELAVPILVTEQYPRGLGPTIEPIVTALGDAYAPIDKVAFSCFGERRFVDALAALGRKQVVLIGIESHICVLQTALRGIGRGYLVTVVADAVSARGRLDHTLALEKLGRHGVEIDTWESVAYQWLRQAGTPEFKRTLPLFKTE